ncbi:MAG: response regulator [Deltaproteobacteria bacterium]|nr:response regulator [Deltaproteobacteria bacterium]
MKRSILLVDDERDSLDPIAMLLENEYNVLLAETGEAALSLLEKENIELVVADQRMPGMTGVELLTRVKELYPEIVRLILSAYADFEAMLKAINEGRVYRYIIKPWDIDDMKLTIKQALEWKDLRASKGKLAADLADTNKDLLKKTRQLEEAQEELIKREKLAAVGRFAAEMAHEMNNHLVVLLGMNNMLTRTRENEIQDLKALERQVQTLGGMATHIRDFARGASLPFMPSRISPAGPVEEVLRVCRYHPSFRDIEIEFEKGELKSWLLDSQQVNHLLLNLLKNAAQASEAGSKIIVRIEITGDTLEYRIIDHGVGIPDKAAEKLFEPFYSTKDQEGTGLGLSICKQVMNAHGGTLTFEDTPGGGATFIAKFPQKP